MKSLLSSSALSLLACLAIAQDASPPKETPPATDAPAETIRKAAPAAYLGIHMTEQDGQAVIANVLDGSPAAKAGLKAGDRLTRIGDQAIAGDVSRVTGIVGKCKPGDVIAVHFQRGDKEETLKIELAERPASDDDFRGEFHRRETDLKKSVEEAVKESDKAVKEVERGKRKLEKQLQAAKQKPEQAAGKTDSPKMAARDEKDVERRELELLKKPAQPNFQNPDLMLRWYLDQKWPGDKADQPRWLKLKTPQVHPLAKNAEDAIWKRVEQAVSRALKESDLGPDVTAKVLHAIAAARKHGTEHHARRAHLEAEADKLEKEMQSLKAKADKVREALQQSGE